MKVHLSEIRNRKVPEPKCVVCAWSPRSTYYFTFVAAVSQKTIIELILLSFAFTDFRCDVTSLLHLMQEACNL